MTNNGEGKGSRTLRALELLEAVNRADKPMTVSEIIRKTGLPKATVHRLCALLEHEGFLMPEAGGKGLGFGHRARALALGVMAAGGVDAFRRGILVEVSRDIGETCNLTVPQGNEILYVDRVETEWPLRTQLPVGSRVPLHCTASGKLYLSSLPAARRRKLIGRLRLERHTPQTITDPAALDSEIDAIRREKVGLDNQEFIAGMVAAAVPINDSRGRLAAMLAVHAPVIRMDIEQARTLAPRLRDAAERISADIED